MEVQIDKGIPAPTLPGNQKYPWHALEVGDSFLFPPHVFDARSHVAQASRRYAPMKFVARKTPDGIRCWRIV